MRSRWHSGSTTRCTSPGMPPTNAAAPSSSSRSPPARVPVPPPRVAGLILTTQRNRRPAATTASSSTTSTSPVSARLGGVHAQRRTLRREFATQSDADYYRGLSKFLTLLRRAAPVPHGLVREALRGPGARESRAPARRNRRSGLTVTRRPTSRDAAVLVVEADDVVFLDVVAARDLDDREQVGAAVLEPVHGLHRNEGRFAPGQVEHALAATSRARSRAPRPSARCGDGAAAAIASRRASPRCA